VNIGEFIINIVQSTYATNIFVLITQSGLLIYDSESTQFGDTPPETQFFGPKYDVKDLIFVSSTEIIVLSENEAIGFRQVGNSATPFINIPLERNSVALLRTNEIKQFAVLYDLGMVQYYDWS
jgi:hypothetical protein